MIYILTSDLQVSGADFAAGAPIYTVPRPRGKPAGISGDGRLHLVTLQLQNNLLLDGDVVYLTYTDDTGVERARMPIFQAPAAFSGSLRATLSGEPSVTVSVD